MSRRERSMHKRDEGALLLAKGLSSDAVAERLGMSGSTVRSWRKRPEFVAKVQAARAELLEEAVAAMATGAKKAVVTLLRAMDDESANVRVRAALGFLQQIPPMADHAILEAKVAAFEAAEADREQES